MDALDETTEAGSALGSSQNLSITALPGIPLIEAGDDLIKIIKDGLERCSLVLKRGDILILAQKIISNLNSRNIKVASIKHAHHNFDIDHPETDSYLHRKSGSQEVIISSSKRWAKINELEKQGVKYKYFEMADNNLLNKLYNCLDLYHLFLFFEQFKWYTLNLSLIHI